jgi:glucokinase
MIRELQHAEYAATSQKAEPLAFRSTTASSTAEPCFSIGIDLGGTNLRIAAYSGDAEKIQAVSVRTRLKAGPEAVLQDMADAVRRIHSQCGNHGEFAGVGIGSPGPIWLPEGRLLAPANLPGWDGLELKAELERRLDMPVIVESDANAAALAEWHLGSGRAHDTDSMAMFTLGTGVGGGLVLNRKIWHGAMGMAAEPGHTVVYPDGLPCNCGSHGCLEMYASATAVRRMARDASSVAGGSKLKEIYDRKGEINAHDAAVLAREGDAASIGIFEVVGEALGIGLASAVGTLNLSSYTIGGGMAQAWDLFAPSMYRSLYRCSQIYRLTQPGESTVFEPRRTNVLPALLGPEAGLIGAALLPHFQ